MAKKKNTDSTYVLFNVLYQDGGRSSNRKVPRSLIEGLDGDAPAKTLIEQQDREIAEKSGQPRGPIKSITRAPV